MISAKENVSRLYQHKMPEYQPFMGQGIINNVPVTGYQERGGGRGSRGRDWFGVEWIWPEEEPASFPSNEILLEDICDWKDVLHFPDLDNFDWEEAARKDRIPAFDRKHNLLYQMIHNGLFERLHTLMGFEDALCALLTDPDEIAEFFDALADYKCKLIDYIAKYYQPDIICYHDDWGTERGLFFSPETWRDLIKEPTRRIIDHVHSKGILFELHSDGDIHDLIPEIVEDLKPDALNIMEINNIPEMKKLTGDKVVYNVFMNTRALDVMDAAQPVTEEQVRTFTRDTLHRNGKGGFYIPCLILCRPEWQTIIMDEYEKIKFDIL